MSFASYLRFHHIDLTSMSASHFLHLLASANAKRRSICSFAAPLDVSLLELVDAHTLFPLSE